MLIMTSWAWTYSDASMYLFFGKSYERQIFLHFWEIYWNQQYVFKILWPKTGIEPFIYLEVNNLHGYTMSKFLPTDGFERIDPKRFDSNKCGRNSSKGFVWRWSSIIL